MTAAEAKKILALFRPGSADEADPDFREALQLAKSDPEVRGWFETHCESYRIMREKMRGIRVPPGLKEQIISERKVRQLPVLKHWRPILAAAAALALLISVEMGVWHRGPSRFNAYCMRMTEIALQNYAMGKLSTNAVEIESYLAENESPTNYTLPNGLKAAQLVGCAVEGWQDKHVSMLCFKTGRPLPPGNQSDLWLFVADRDNLKGSPPPGGPVFNRVNEAAIATWSDDKKIYMLAAMSDQAFLGKFVQ